MSIGCVCERTQRFINLRENCIQKYTGTLFISVSWCLGDIECRRLSIQPAHHFGVRDFFPFIAVTVKDCGVQSCLDERELNVIECQWAIRRRTLHVASAADACGPLRYKKFDEWKETGAGWRCEDLFSPGRLIHRRVNWVMIGGAEVASPTDIWRQ